ncbi:SGNH/GDSL hydrolase family protein [Pseudonocardia hydrocarbonoxydans]|jgi:lysophospholipase L1-like esterase|uniref:SGNH hydrolase n=1 Tax=Pseudonocardia hydrocarbonoxydans TaxID=76726 RepID=A0A4Y3WPW8_9PSEU|nr:SGNH/GDSL hydrolase family protein [Pseudonocardia hydrocarbonoxydans]GEC20932.1 SGNH hydrolase [Pseudonocardia hydrocarbonoxydans]
MDTWNSFVAIGDSFTEGLDDWRPDGTPRGWADRVAEHVAAGRPGFRYANLAVRGKLLDQIVADQIPVAERLRPDLVAFCAGGNDLIRFSCDIDDLAARFDAALGRLTATGAEVFIFTGFDLGRMHPLIRRLRGRVACFNESMRAAAERHGAHVVDLWGMAPLADPRAWGPDRLHLRPDAHRRVALRVLETLGQPVSEDWRVPAPDADPLTWRARQAEDLRWMREFAMPFVRRRIQGRRTGDGFVPKRPDLSPLDVG